MVVYYPRLRMRVLNRICGALLLCRSGLQVLGYNIVISHAVRRQGLWTTTRQIYDISRLLVHTFCRGCLDLIHGTFLVFLFDSLYIFRFNGRFAFSNAHDEVDCLPTVRNFDLFASIYCWGMLAVRRCCCDLYSRWSADIL